MLCDHPNQMGAISNYEEFLGDLDRVWKACFDALVPGGRLVCVIGDVCLSRKKNGGGYRSPSLSTRILSIIPGDKHKEWFQQVWSGVTGASTRQHPAPYPMELAERLVRMFSFVGDTVLDPFLGTGTSSLAAARWGRNSVGVEVDPLGPRARKLLVQHEVHLHR